MGVDYLIDMGLPQCIGKRFYNPNGIGNGQNVRFFQKNA